MSNNMTICPACATGECKYRNGIKCTAWVCASGIYKDANGNVPNGYANGNSPFGGDMPDFLKGMFGGGNPFFGK